MKQQIGKERPRCREQIERLGLRLIPGETYRARDHQGRRVFVSGGIWKQLQRMEAATDQQVKRSAAADPLVD